MDQLWGKAPPKEKCFQEENKHEETAGPFLIYWAEYV
jgi:hypothetical protein